MNRTINIKSWDESFDHSIKEFLKEIEQIIASVPVEFKNDVRIEFDRYGDPAEITISYVRPETQQEINIRNKYEIKQQEEQEKRDRAALARLKAKYEGK